MAAAATASVEQVLRAYTGHGVFQALDVRAGTSGSTEFMLHWLTDVPVRLVYDGKERLLTVKNILPNVSKRSPLYADLQRFLEERRDETLPAHQRIDPRALDVAWVVERGHASLAIKVLRGDAANAVRRALNLTHELFIFLNASWPEYMWESFEASTE